MAIIRWDPFRDLQTLRERMNVLFGDVYSSPAEEKDLFTSTWNPSVDIYEHNGNLVLTAEVPGLDEDDIEVKLEDSTLTIKGERKYKNEVKEENYHRVERSYGSFSRSFSLPQNIDQEKIKAENENGILKITMPKKAELKPKKVKVLKPKSESKNKK
jgi:HSP20 family protein